MENEKKIIIILIFLSFFLSSLYFLGILNFLQTVRIVSIYIPAVVITPSNFTYGVLTKFTLYAVNGNGRIYVSLPPVGEEEFYIGFIFAKDAACEIFPNCNDYDYIFNINNVNIAEGMSDTAGLFVLYSSVLQNKEPELDYPITGWVWPNGIVAPVAGLEYKYEAAKERGFNKIAAPEVGKDFISIYTILDILKIYFGDGFSYNFTIPEQYIEVTKEIAEGICNGINNSTVEELLEDKLYYSAASVCFEIRSTNYYVNISKEELDKDINELEKEIEEYKCNSYSCEEIKYQVLSRIQMAESINDTSEAYWRYYTALNWMNYLNVSVNRIDTCNNIEENYYSFIYFYPQLPTNLSCWEIRDALANFYYEVLSNTSWLNNQSFSSVKDLIYYYYSKNGFSITSYNYLQLAQTMYEMGESDSALYFLLEALEYAI